MKLFLDSADLAAVRRFRAWRIVDGITTTPTFFRRLGVQDTAAAVTALAAEFDGEIHVEALGRSVAEIVASCRANHRLAPKVVSKVPISPDAIEAVAVLGEEGIAVNVHLVFTVNQAVLAAKAGAAYVCPLLGRMADAGLNGCHVVSEMVQALALQPGLSTMVMLSSLRTAEDARRALLTGAQAITAPPRVLDAMLRSPLTDKAASVLFRDSVETATVRDRMRGLDRLPKVEPDCPLMEAAAEMTLTGIGIAAVLSGGRLVGVITDGDIRRSLRDQGTGQPAQVRAGMSSSPKTVGPEEPLNQALQLFQQHHVGQLVVVDDEGAPLGLLNLHDLMEPPNG